MDRREALAAMSGLAVIPAAASNEDASPPPTAQDIGKMVSALEAADVCDICGKPATVWMADEYENWPRHEDDGTWIQRRAIAGIFLFCDEHNRPSRFLRIPKEQLRAYIIARGGYKKLSPDEIAERERIEQLPEAELIEISQVEVY